MKIKEVFPKIDLKNMKDPMVRMFILCLVYNALYLWIQIFLFEQKGMFQGSINALSILSSIGLYYLCLKSWEKTRKIEAIQIVYVLGLQSIYIGLIYLVMLPLYNLLSGNSVGYLCIQIVCAFLLFTMIPLQLLMYKALSEGKNKISEMKDYIIPLVKDNYKELLNQYLSVMLLVILIDVLLGGQISASGVASSMINVEKGRIDALSVCMNTLYVANPWMMFAVGVMAIFIYPVNTIQALFVLVIYVAIGIVLSLLEISYIQYIGNLERKKKNKNGTKKVKANR